MKRTRNIDFLSRLLLPIAVIAGALVVCLAVAGDVLARVGGGQSYGGGGGQGSSGGGGAIIGVVRLLVWLTIEYPPVGVPVDIVVIGFVVFRFARRGSKGAEAFSSASPAAAKESIAFPLGLDS